MVKTIFTNTGMSLMFGKNLVLSKATLYSQDISKLSDDDLRKLTKLDGELLSEPMRLGEAQADSKQIAVKVTFSNADQTKDIEFSAIGWFAVQNKTESLIAVTVFDNPEIIASAPPGGVATCSKDLTLNIGIGDSTKVDVIANPAGTVSQADFAKSNSALQKQIDSVSGHANSLESQLKNYSAKVSEDEFNKAQSNIDKRITDLAKNKADQKTVDDAISKIDFTPYAKTADVKQDIKTVTDALATKANSADVATHADFAKSNSALQKQIDSVSEHANSLESQLKNYSAKVSEDEFNKAQSNIDKRITDLAKNKADQKTVDDAISKIDFTPYAKTADVKQDIKTVTDALATKANSAGTVSQADFAKSNSALQKQIDSVSEHANSLESQLKNYSAKVSEDEFNKAQSNIDKRITDLAKNKADQKTVDDAISKIDFTPYAKTADVKQDIKTVTDALATKANSAGTVSQADFAKSNSALQKQIDSVSEHANSLESQLKNYSAKVSEDEFNKAQSNIDKRITDLAKNKADQKTVDDAISKIDFTPYAKTADVKQDIKTVTDALATKANSADVATHADFAKSNSALQKQIDSVSEHANSLESQLKNYSAKVSEDEFNKAQSNIDKRITDLAKNKADQKTVDDAISKIDFTPYAKTADVKQDIKTVTDALATKANSADVATHADITALQGSINKVKEEASEVSDAELDELKKTVADQAKTIQALTTRLTTAEQGIKYLKDTSIQGKVFSTDQKKEALAWSKDNAQRFVILENKEKEEGKK